MPDLTAPPGDDDRALLARHSAGDRDAFGVLVSRHRDRLWRVALRTLGDREDAADALQDAMVSAYRAAASFRGDAAVTTWLHRIVVNACLDLARRRSARPSVPLDGSGNGVGSSTSGIDAVPDPRAGDAFDAADTASAVLRALRQIPTDQAAAIVLVDVEGFPVREAAAILEVPEGTVKSRCARGRAALALLLSELSERNEPAAPPVQPTGNEREST